MEKVEAKILTQNSGTTWVRLFISHWVLVIGILVLAAFLRLYKISEYMTFLGDEGRDVLIVKHLLEGDIVGLGPTASVGGFFTGPIYYYFMAPFLWLFRLDPVGPAVMVALFGIATVFLVYFVGKEFFNEKVGIFASALYTVSPIIIASSRSSWNPNILPFFAILTIFFVYKFVQKNSLRYLLLAGLLIGIAVQLHYIATFLATAVALYLVFIRSRLVRGLTFTRSVIVIGKQYIILFLGFLIGYFPFLAFEATHGFPNTITVIKFILGGTGETGFAEGRFTTIVGDVFFRLFGRLITHFPPPEQINLGKDALAITLYGIPVSLPLSLVYLVTNLLALGSIFVLVKQMIFFKKKDLHYQAYMLLFVWFVVGVLLFGFYKKPIYDYYFTFMFPLPFLLVGNLLYEFSRIKIFGKVLALGIFFFLFLLNFDGIPFRYIPNRQLAQVRQISEFVLEKTNDQPFNFALITGGNSDHAYRYFFELTGKYPVTIENELNDPERKTVTDQLLIICEDQACQPLGHPLWEVAGFGRAELVGEWWVSVVKVYKLTHYKGD